MIVEPVARIQCRVVVRHKQRAVILVRSRPRLQPDLRGSVCGLRVGGRRHNLHLFHQVGADIRGVLTLKVVTDAVPRIVDDNAIAIEIHRADPLAGEASFGAGACCGGDQLKNVTLGNGQGFDFDFGKHIADGGGRRRQRHARIRDYFHGLTAAGNLQRKVQPNLLALAQRHVLEALRLEARQ